MLDTAMAKWNEAKFPTETGEHRALKIFDAPKVFVDNGYNPPLRVRVPVDLTVSLLVNSQLYYGQLPVPHVSGFYDQLSGKVITNAFTVGILDPNEVEKAWLKVNSDADAPVHPGNTAGRTRGLVQRVTCNSMLVDSHCHLDFPDFAADLDGVVGRARAAGIERMVTISTRVKRFDGVLAIAERFPDVYCSVGTHPHNAA